MEFIAKEIRKNDIQNDTESFKGYHIEIIDAIVSLSDHLNVYISKNKTDELMTVNAYSQAIISRFLMQSKTLIYLLKGTNLTDDSEYYQGVSSIVDISSIFGISKSLIESYLNFYYLFNGLKNSKQLDLRIKILKLYDRSQKAQTDYNREKIEKYIAEIKGHSEFENLSKLKLEFFNREDKTSNKTWKSLIEMEEINIKIANSLHKYYSKLADTNYKSSIETMNVYKDYDEKIPHQIMMVIQNQLTVASILVLEYKKLFSVLEDNYEEIIDPVTQFKIKYWNSMYSGE